MSVLYLTVFLSLLLAIFFAAGFLYHHDFSGGDPLRDSLLPFDRHGGTPKGGAPEGGEDKSKS